MTVTEVEDQFPVIKWIYSDKIVSLYTLNFMRR